MKHKINLYYNNGLKSAGKNSKTLVSVLTGATSPKDVANQLKKIETVSKLEFSEQPDIISDLSLQTSKSFLYKDIIENFPDYIVSTLPIYQCKIKDKLVDENELLEIAQEQIEKGVSFITIHPTINYSIMQLAQKRIVPWTSRGGAIVMNDLSTRNFHVDNVYIKILDEIIVLAKKHKTVISIGASFRSANIFDSVDECQIEEFKLQKEIADYIYDRGVDVIIEGPGHSSPNKLKDVAQYYQKMGYPIMPLGPIPTDISIGQDHISSAIGATILGMLDCVDIITSVTREEHTGKIPSVESSIEAIKAAKIAAHIIDLYKVEDFSQDNLIVQYRAKHQTCIYGKKSSGCSRCAHVCPLKIRC
ncbi:phosphomethylpyrimidine synthase ThiC [Chryseobacterium sp. 09-1422]|uniref:Phosphomethylpyrimidine synthase ThiC n=1 Tax=Chryseobacterium kimseyorum TaxID=2984028 RepID=A0ABT3HYI3_9FLAO|nr:phosphomethylpyrimidine synthase ThiC [Chryseobacterium kimseyorum]MCW3168819.1 phosphomethylpyrimidine synthase ThiC [Chryseobacterium kimseyorum]